MTILDLSKLFMFQFHYDHMLPKYNTRTKLLMTNTDSLINLITTADVYKNISKDINLFNTCDYPIDHSCHSTIN